MGLFNKKLKEKDFKNGDWVSSEILHQRGFSRKVLRKMARTGFAEVKQYTKNNGQIVNMYRLVK